MKIRTAFVSNSSSSNFCVMGFELPGHYEREDVLKLLGFQFDKNDERDEDDYEDDMDDAWYEYINNNEDGITIVDAEDSPKLKYMIGVNLVKNEDYGLTGYSFDWTKVNDILNKIGKLFNKNDGRVVYFGALNNISLRSETPIKIISGQKSH